ncbi:hypothetical protein [Glutamicibacter sp. M10]|nr:hypothetical protein [Glutamicibacter sp. M10]
MTARGFYQPNDAWVGDVIPWQEDGVFHLFYLHEDRGATTGECLGTA